MTDVFTGDTGKPEDTQQTQNVLDQLVGEGKKYQTPEMLAASRIEADRFIEQLKMEKEAMRKQLEETERKAQEGTTLRELMETLKAQKSDSANPKDGEGNQSTITPEDLKKLVASQIEERDAAKSKESNRAQANRQLLEKFEGKAEAAQAFVKQRASELGLTPKDLGEMSENSPKAFATLMGFETTTKGTGSINPSQLSRTNTEAFNVVPPEQRTVEFYQKLKRENSKEFWGPRTQQELMKLGDKVGIEKLREILYG